MDFPIYYSYPKKKKRKSSVAVLLSFGKFEKEKIEKCIHTLETQTYKRFDVVISTLEKEKAKFVKYLKKTKLRWILLLQKNDWGGAGNWYCGWEFCIKNGYKFLINYEDDVIVGGRNVVEKLVKKAKQSTLPIVACEEIVTSSDGFHWVLPKSIYNLFHFSLVKLEKVNFYPPYYLFLGGEDFFLYFLYRAEKIDEVVKHPFKSFHPGKWALYVKNALIVLFVLSLYFDRKKFFRLFTRFMFYTVFGITLRHTTKTNKDWNKFLFAIFDESYGADLLKKLKRMDNARPIVKKIGKQEKIYFFDSYLSIFKVRLRKKEILLSGAGRLRHILFALLLFDKVWIKQGNKKILVKDCSLLYSLLWFFVALLISPFLFACWWISNFLRKEEIKERMIIEVKR